MVKNLPAMRESWVQSLGWEDPLEEGMATHSSILAWRSLVGCSPWGHKESDTIEQLTHREFYLQKNRLSEVILVITNEETFEAK